jgi:hypothetical protein
MFRLAFLITITVAWCSPEKVFAQAPVDGAADQQAGEESNQTPELLKKFYRREAEKYEFAFDEAGKQKPILQPTVMTWTGEDYKSAIGTIAPNSGAVYVWTYEGRAVIVGGIGSFPFRTSRDVFHEFHVLSELKPQPTRIHNSQRTLIWKPTGEAPRPIEGAPAPAVGETPAATRNRRLLQMRKLAEEFAGSTVNPEETGGVAKLRLLPAPLYRLNPKALESVSHNVVDGALFVFIGEVGTDAEMLLNIECRKTDHGLEYTYVPAAWTYLEMWMEHKGKEVWHVPRYTNDGGEHNYFTGIAERLSAQEDLRARLEEK